MSLANIIFSLSLLAFFMSFRIFEESSLLILSSIVTGLGVLAGIGLQISRFRKAAEGRKRALRTWLFFASSCLLGIIVFLVGTLKLVNLETKNSEFILTSIWFSFTIVGAVGTIILDDVYKSSPVLLPIEFVKKGTKAALLVAFSFLLLFPTNYLAHHYNLRHDFSFFKTASPGESTVKLAKDASSPFVIYVFSSASSEVGIELADYFHELKKRAPIRIELVDQIANPALSKKLKIRDNGYVVISTESISSKDKPSVMDRMSKKAVRPQKIRIGKKIDDKQVKDKLRNLDARVRKAMIALERGRLNAYVSTGHSELSWKGNAKPIRKIRVFKEGLETYNFRLKNFGPTDGLATKIPKSAALLLVLGPDLGLSKDEYLSIKNYLQKGGSLLLAVEAPEFRESQALEAKDDYSQDLMEWMGVAFEEGVLMSKTGMQPVTRSKQDHMHFITKQFETHPSLSTINSDSTQSLGLFVSTAGALKTLDKEERKIKTVVRSPSRSWMEKNNNLEADKDELKGSRPVAIAIEGKNWRAFVTSDATIFSDFAMQNSGNQQLSLDVVNWLSRLEVQSGELSNERDKPFVPTKEGQAIWFYLSILGVPIAVLIFGWIRVRRRGRD